MLPRTLDHEVVDITQLSEIHHWIGRSFDLNGHYVTQVENLEATEANMHETLTKLRAPIDHLDSRSNDTIKEELLSLYSQFSEATKMLIESHRDKVQYEFIFHDRNAGIEDRRSGTARLE